MNTRHKKVLFLCSANYYRSRFAEHLFNHWAERAGLDWRADSRGLMVGHWGNIGPISPFTVEGLRQRGITPPESPRQPQQLSAVDLVQSDLVVAVKEAEHRPAMMQLFPEWAKRIEYWHIDDLDCAGPDEALTTLEHAVRQLLSRLAPTADAA